MIPQRMLLTRGLAIAAMLTGTAVAPLRADDTDIYINANNATGGVPMVMFSLDWRPNLTSTVCQGTIEVPVDPDDPAAGTQTVNECEWVLGGLDGGTDYLRPVNEDGSTPQTLEATDPTDKHTLFDLLLAVLKRVLDPLEGFKVGLMMNHHHINNCEGPANADSNRGCSNGGYIVSEFKWISDDPTTDVDESVEYDEFFDKFEFIPLPEVNKEHKYQGKELFFEFFRYLSGGAVFNGHNGWQDYGTDSDFNLDNENDITVDGKPTPPWDTDAEIGETGYYQSPLAAAPECSSLYTVNVMFQVSQQEADSDYAIDCETDGCMKGIDLSGNRNEFPTVIEYLHDIDLADDAGTFNGLSLPGHQNVRSYFVVDQVDTKTNSYARAGGTGGALELSEDPNELIATFTDIFKQILTVSTTFVSPSVPVNVFNRARTLNEVFIALFEADINSRPQWVGNLKKLKIDDSDPNSPFLVDVNDSAAVAIDGRITHGALTFWTHPEDLEDPVATDDFLPGADGRTVNRGGAGSVVPGYRPGQHPGTANPLSGEATWNTNRIVFTEPDSPTNGTADTLMALNADDTVAATLLAGDDPLFQKVCAAPENCLAGVGSYGALANATEQAAAQAAMVKLLKHIRGIDVTDEDNDLIYDETRPWLVADSLHSRPLPLNYGAHGDFTEENPDVRVVMGTNDGLLHMFQAADASIEAGGITPREDYGVEKWAFMPREVMAARVRLMKNNAGVAPLHPYMVDGPPTAFVIDNDADGNIEAGDGDRVVLYFGMRRGGKSYYALDISDPDSPKLLWSIRKGTSCDPLIDPVNHDFCELGQSWSAPRVARLSIDFDGPDGEAPQDKFVLMFAGGYNGDDGGDGIDDTDPVEMGKDARDDDDPNFTGSDDDEGNAVFMVDALDGSLIWKAIDTDVESAVAGFVANPVVSDLERVHYQHPDLDDSIPSDLSVIDTDANGYADRFYVGDTSGTIWRGDILGADRTQWKLTKLASVGRHFSNTKADDRRFFHRIDFVRARDDTGDYDGVLIGSGDRAHPLGDESVNYFYLFKDRAVLSGFPPSTVIGHDDVADLTDNCLADGDAVDCSDSDALDKLDVGWRIKLQQCEGLGQTGSCGEKSLARALTLKGTVYFTTYVPPVESITDICSPSEGEGLFYAVDLTAAQPVLNFDQSNDTNGETLERFEELDSSGIPAQLVPLGGGNILRGDLKIQHIPQGAGSKTFWYERYFQ